MRRLWLLLTIALSLISISSGAASEIASSISRPLRNLDAKWPDSVALFLIQLVSNKPVETLIYTSNLAHKPVYVRTPDGKTWIVGDGKMQIVKKPDPKH
jgi:hypothetical protein